jgi:hypothetical protein
MILPLGYVITGNMALSPWLAVAVAGSLVVGYLPVRLLLPLKPLPSAKTQRLRTIIILAVAVTGAVVLALRR